MFVVSKRIEISGAHRLDLPYASPCKRLHGHNWIIEVDVSCDTLDASGMVINFVYLEEVLEKTVKERLDHQCLNDWLKVNPTAENIAEWVAQCVQQYLTHSLHLVVADRVLTVSRVTVQESEGNKACYIP